MINIDPKAVKELLSAASRGDLEQLDNLLTKLKVPIDCVDDQSQTALHYACANGHLKLVRHLIKKGAPLEFKNWCGWTPILLAACYGHAEVVNLLLQNKANVNADNDRAVTLLTCAARFGQVQIVQSLLEQHGAQIIGISDSAMKVYVTPLMAAAQHGYTKIVHLLLQYDNKATNYANPDSGYTALMLAALNGHLEVVQMLLEKGGADANLENTAHQTAYNVSVLRQKHAVAEYLKNRTERRVKYVAISEKSLFDAVKENCVDLVRKYLNQEKYDVNMTDEDGATPLVFACISGNVEIIKLLLDCRANPNVQDHNYGWTPLMQATLSRQIVDSRQRVDIIMLLLTYNADISIKNYDKLTAFDLATRVGVPEITRLLAPNTNNVVFNRIEDLEKKMKGTKESWISKVQSKIGMKRGGPTFSREPVQIRDMNENNEESGGELKKTSSALSIFDANKAMSGLAKARLTLLSPQVVLPDDVVAPTLPPFSKLPGYDLPKMPGTRLSSSNGSNGTEWSPKNSSDDSASLKAHLPNMGHKKTRNLKRPQQENVSIPAPNPTWEPDSPLSSMTSSEFTSISQCKGPAVMPRQFLKGVSPTFAERIDFQDIEFNKFSNFDQQSIMQQKRNKVKKLPQLSHTPTPPKENEDIESLLQNLSLEQYRANFHNEGVDYETLKVMDDDDLRQMGIDHTLERGRILESVGKSSGRVKSRTPSRTSGGTPTRRPSVTSTRTAGTPTGRSSGTPSRRNVGGAGNIHDVHVVNSIYQPSPPPPRTSGREKLISLRMRVDSGAT